MKYLYIRQNIENPNYLIIGDENKIGGRDKAYTHKGSTIKNKKGQLDIEYPRVTKDIELGKNGYTRDYQVHTFIKNNCYDLVYYDNKEHMNTREGFIAIKDPEVVINELYKRINNEVNGTKNVTLWSVKQGPQKEATKALAEFLATDRKEFLLNAFCRMGKTFTSLYTFLNSNYKTAMFISGKTEAIAEVELTPHRCSNFEDIKVIDFEEYDKLLKAYKLPNRYIIADTCQTLQARDKKNKKVPKVGMIFFDECHYYNTSKIQDIIKNKYDKLVYMSATPEQLSNSGNYLPIYKNIYEFTLVDLYKKLMSGILSEDEYILPKMFIPNIASYISRAQTEKGLKESTLAYLKECEDENGFSFSSFLEMDNSNTFIHNDEVELFAKALAQFLKDAGKKIKYDGQLKNFMIFMPQHQEKTKLFAEMLKNNLSKNDNVFVAVADNNGVTKENLLSQVKSSMSAQQGLTVVLTYQRFGTGSTIEDLQAVMFLNDTDNASVILQNLSRCLSTNGEKKYGVVFEMNQSRAILDRFKIICSKFGQMLTGSEAQKVFGEVKNLMPINLITEFGDLEEVELNYNEAFMSYRKLNGASNIFNSDIDYEAISNLLNNIKKFESSTNLTKAQKALVKAAKVIKTVRGKRVSKEGKTTSIEEIKAKLLTLSNYLKTAWYCSDAKTIEEFINFFSDKENAEDFFYSTSIKFKDFKNAILPIIDKEKFEVVCNDFSETVDESKLETATAAMYTPFELIEKVF